MSPKGRTQSSRRPCDDYFTLTSRSGCASEISRTRLTRPASLAIGAVLLALGLVGCNEAKTTDIVGTWNLTATSRRYLPPDMAGISPRLVLGADGRFTATDLPGAFHGTVGVIDRNSGTGKWTFITKDGRQQIQLTFEGDYGTQVDIAKDGAWKLRYFLGDPDEHRRLEYVKVASGP